MCRHVLSICQAMLSTVAWCGFESRKSTALASIASISSQSYSRQSQAVLHRSAVKVPLYNSSKHQVCMDWHWQAERCRSSLKSVPHQVAHAHAPAPTPPTYLPAGRGSARRGVQGSVCHLDMEYTAVVVVGRRLTLLCTAATQHDCGMSPRSRTNSLV